MGCFSFMCKVCGEAVLSDSFSGDKVKLFLLKEGKVVQQMEGEYDSYGRVFTEDKKESYLWRVNSKGGADLELPEKSGSKNDYDGWDNVCNLMFDKNERSGIAAIHTKCDSGLIPTTPSEDDPNQGWGEEE